MTHLQRIAGWLKIAVIPFLAAVWAASYEGQHPLFSPAMVDLQVYRRAASAILAGQDPYFLTDSFPFIYPPFAAVVSLAMAPMTGWVMKTIWIAINTAAVIAMLRRTGLAGWQLIVAATGVLTVVGPTVHVLSIGQLGTVLMVMTVLDQFPVPAGHRRWLPVGVLTGLATGIKLTPAVFVIFFLITGRRKAALTSALTFVVTVVIGFIVIPGPSWGYWGRLAHGDSGANPDAYGWIGNQSVLSAWDRFFGVEAAAGGLALSAILVILALVAGKRWYAANPWLAVGLLGLTSVLANPIAWNHHLTWIVPLAIGAACGSVCPVALRLICLFAAAWWQVHPHGMLPGAPWADLEIHHYTFWQKMLAGGGAMACFLAVIAAIVLSGKVSEYQVTKGQPA